MFFLEKCAGRFVQSPISDDATAKRGSVGEKNNLWTGTFLGVIARVKAKTWK